MPNKRTGYIAQSVAPWSPGTHANKEGKTDDWIAEECAVALVYNGVSHVVMMVSPVDLKAFAIGFSYTEGIVDTARDIYEINILEHTTGLEIALTISAQCFMRLKHKRRSLEGRTGCGICGATSLDQLQAAAATPVSGNFSITHAVIDHAVKHFIAHQPLQEITGAVHGAAWCNNKGSIIRVCEDVGRHNALDKLIGSLLGGSELTASGFLLISSRASYEMIQKAASANMAIVVAVSAPTSLAIAVAEQAQLTLVGFSRADRHVVYTQGQRII